MTMKFQIKLREKTKNNNTDFSLTNDKRSFENKNATITSIITHKVQKYIHQDVVIVFGTLPTITTYRSNPQYQRSIKDNSKLFLTLTCLY